MSELTQADIDKAIADALAKQQESIDRLESKNAELVGELRKARKGAEIKPEDLTAAEDRAEKAENALAEANKSIKTLTAERDKSIKALEAESGAARKFALEAELATAIAEGNVVPALVPAFKAMVASQAKADLVDGAYSVTIGDKPARDHIKAFLDSDDGKAFRAAAANGGGGAQGGAASGATDKTATRAQFDGMDPASRMDFVKSGGKVSEAV